MTWPVQRWFAKDHLEARRWPWWALDIAVACASAVVAVGESERTAGLGHGSVLEQVVAVVWFLCIAARRLAPVIALWLAAGATAVAAIQDYPLTNLSLATALALALVVRGRPGAVAAAVSVLPVTVALAALATHSEGVDTIALAVTAHALAIVFGLVWRSGARSAAALADLRRRQAVEEERARLAHDLHDSVGHAVTLMLTHAGAARLSLPAPEGPAHQSLLRIEQAGRTAMQDLDVVLHLLESPPEATDLPATGHELGQLLEELVARVPPPLRATLTHSSAPNAAPLPPAVSQVLYRVVQESLTNVVRYARATVVTVVVTHRADAIEVEVSDDGTSTPPSPPVGPAEASPG